jgi:hypothetical protein
LDFKKQYKLSALDYTRQFYAVFEENINNIWICQQAALHAGTQSMQFA